MPTIPVDVAITVTARIYEGGLLGPDEIKVHLDVEKLLQTLIDQNQLVKLSEYIALK